MVNDYYSYIHKSFGKWASVYDLFVLPISSVRGKVVSLAEAKEGSKILDVCTGTGKQAFAFAEKGYEVVGIDLSPDMLTVARRKNKYKNVKLKVADATNIPFADKSFDVSCISFALHDMPHEIRHKVLGEMKRVSRRIVIVDYYIPKNKLHRWFHVSFTSLYESKYYKDFAGQDLKELLERHDLRVVKEAYGLIDFVKIVVCNVANKNGNQR